MFRSNSQKRTEEATEEAADFFEHRDKIEKVLIIFFAVAITTLICLMLGAMK